MRVGLLLLDNHNRTATLDPKAFRGQEIMDLSQESVTQDADWQGPSELCVLASSSGSLASVLLQNPQFLLLRQGAAIQRVSPRARGLMSSCHMRGCPAFGEPPGRRGRRQRVSENGFPAVHPLSCRIPSEAQSPGAYGVTLRDMARAAVTLRRARAQLRRSRGARGLAHTRAHAFTPEALAVTLFYEKPDF
ncbi:hypothetical protein CB1_000197026 [Camelus ferus]|nr:hypothetical protein CB1_000197026 [Camelus ferus]